MSSEVQSPTMIVLKMEEGQLTIPDEFRAELGIEANAMVHMTLVEGELRIRPVSIGEVPTGSLWLRELYDYFAPVREEIIAAGYSEEEVNADIDAAVRAVREQYG